MVDSIREMIRESFRYEDAVKCTFGLNSLDLEIYKKVSVHGPITTEELGEIVKRERSTVYRSLQNLIACGIAYRKKKSIEGGGYYYEYTSVESWKVKQVLKKNIDDWYYQMNEIIEKNELVDNTGRLK